MSFLKKFNNPNVTVDNEKFQAFLDHSANGILFVDAQLTITHASTKAKQLFAQYQSAFQATSPLFDINNLANKNLKDFSLIPAEALESVRNHKTWSRLLDVAREKFHFTLTPFFDAQNGFKGAMLEFWWAMAAEDSEKLHAFLGHTANGILFMDAQFAITHASTKAKQLFGQYQQAFQAAMPMFDIDNLVNKNLKDFNLIPAEALESVRNHKTWVRMLDVAREKFHFTLTPFFDAQNNLKGAMLEFWWATEYHKMERDVARASSLVKEMTVPVMTCDSNRVITSMNPAVVGLLNKYKSDLQKLMPTFDPDKLIGVNIDAFHKNPDVQKGIFADPSKLPYKTRIKLLEMAFDLTVFPLKNPQGKTNGYAVEWLDATREAKSVIQVDQLTQKIMAGELGARLNVENFPGDLRFLANNVNIMLDAIVKPLNGVADVLAQIERGDLTRTIEGDYRGDLKDFKDTVNSTVAKLSSTIQEVMGATEQLGNASEQISATSQSLSQASSEQAASVDQTSSSVEQMAASINQNAENAKITNSMASKASHEAREGGMAVKQTVAAMQEIASKIGIIDDIAYQTNMLALNAAIEAARAGDHGKGFAVVAAEVRKLAERSQVAAQEIGRLAESSVQTAETAGKLLDEIVPSIMKTSDLVQEISAASQEQSAGVSQINTAMNQMNQVTQQNASASEELAATAEQMTSQTEQLQDLMRFFKIGNGANVSRQSTVKHARRMHDKAKPALVVNHNPFEAEAEFDLSKFNRF